MVIPRRWRSSAIKPLFRHGKCLYHAPELGRLTVRNLTLGTGSFLRRGAAANIIISTASLSSQPRSTVRGRCATGMETATKMMIDHRNPKTIHTRTMSAQRTVITAGKLVSITR